MECSTEMRNTADSGDKINWLAHYVKHGTIFQNLRNQGGTISEHLEKFFKT